MLIDDVLNRVKLRVTKEEYRRYISNLKLNSRLSSNNSFVLEADNIFIAKWVNRNYLSIIKGAFESEVNSKVEIHFTFKGQDNSLKDINSDSKDRNQSSFLNPSLTFDSFIVGESNQFAYTASLNSAKELGILFNPLFIYGTSGIGKTHLLNAIGNYNISRGKVVIYATIEQFMNDFTFHIKRNSMEKFKAKYRECDLLLIDDVQFVSKKDKLQEEFFHTFNEIHNKSGQIVLTADVHPKKIDGLEERLRSRFEWGMIVDIQPSDIETRVEIIRKKCEIDGIDLSEPVIKYIATNLNNNIREIEGVLIQLNAKARWSNQKITLSLVKQTIDENAKEQNEEITIEKVIDIVSKVLGVRDVDIKSRSRNKNIAKARRIVIFLSRELTATPTPILAQFFNLKDHSSISHTIKRVKKEIDEDSNLELLVGDLRQKLLTNY